MPIVKTDGARQIVAVSDSSEIFIQTVSAADLSGALNFDHGTLLNLGDDDHTQYHNDTRGDARYAPVAHSADTSNPHVVTKAQLALDQVNNTSDINKPVSTATQTALDLKASLVGVETFTNKTMESLTNTLQANGIISGVTNQTGSAITKGQVLSVLSLESGETYERVGLADQATSIAMYLAAEDIVDTAEGRALHTGVLYELNTLGTAVNAFCADISGWDEGTLLYVNGAGKLTKVAPIGGWLQPIAYVLRAHATLGVLKVFFDNPKQAATGHFGALQIGGNNATAQALTAAVDGTLQTDTDFVTLYDDALYNIWGAGELNGITAGPDYLTVVATGVYKIEFYASFQAPNNSNTAIRFVINDTTPYSTRRLLRTATSATDWGVIAGQGLVSLTAGDNFRLKVACNVTGSILIDSATMLLTGLQ